MTKNEIILIAEQAHFNSKTWLDIYKDDVTAGDVRGYLEAFAKLVAAKTEAKKRDACATIYAQLFTDPENQPTQYGTVTVEFMNREIAKKQEDIIQIIKETPFSNWFQADVIEAIRAREEK